MVEESKDNPDKDEVENVEGDVILRIRLGECRRVVDGARIRNQRPHDEGQVGTAKHLVA